MKPIYELTKKGATFEWTPRHQAAFEAVKNLMRNDLFLSGFDFEKPTVLETDSSGVAYAGVISQRDENGDLRPVLMFSHTFTTEQMNWPTHDKELYAIVYAFTRYRHFLQGHPTPVEVFSDHQALAKFMTTTDLSKKDRHRRWAELLSEFNFLIQYRPGKENIVADTLSRYNLGDGEFENFPLLPRSRFSEKALKPRREEMSTVGATLGMEESRLENATNRRALSPGGLVAGPEASIVLLARPAIDAVAEAVDRI